MHVTGCSHITSHNNQVRGHRTGSSHLTGIRYQQRNFQTDMKNMEERNAWKSQQRGGGGDKYIYRVQTGNRPKEGMREKEHQPRGWRASFREHTT